MKLLSSARKLKEREETPEPFEDPYSDMIPDEKSKMIIVLVAAREWNAEHIRLDEVRIDGLLFKVDELLSLQRAAMTAEKERDDYKEMNSNLLSVSGMKCFCYNFHCSCNIYSKYISINQL